MSKRKRTKPAKVINDARTAPYNHEQHPLSMAATVVPESLCERARRLAREENEKRENEYQGRVNKLLKDVCGGEVPARNDDGTYTICGYRWRVFGCRDVLGDRTPHLECHDTHRGRFVDPYTYRDILHGTVCDSTWVRDVASLGRALARFDECKADLDAAHARKWTTRFLNLFRRS